MNSPTRRLNSPHPSQPFATPPPPGFRGPIPASARHLKRDSHLHAHSHSSSNSIWNWRSPPHIVTLVGLLGALALLVTVVLGINTTSDSSQQYYGTVTGSFEPNGSIARLTSSFLSFLHLPVQLPSEQAFAPSSLPSHPSSSTLPSLDNNTAVSPTSVPYDLYPTNGSSSEIRSGSTVSHTHRTATNASTEPDATSDSTANRHLASPQSPSLFSLALQSPPSIFMPLTAPAHSTPGPPSEPPSEPTRLRASPTVLPDSSQSSPPPFPLVASPPPSPPIPPLPANVTRWRSFFSRTVLVIVFNNPGFALNASCSLLRELYGPLFLKVLLYAPRAVPELGILKLRTAHAGLYGSVPWWYLYTGLPEILRRHPRAEGLLWSNDDVVINYWNLVGANKSRIWFLSNNKQRQRWTDIACCRVDRSLPPDYTTAAWHRWTIGQALASLPARYRAQYNRSIAPRKGKFTKRIADLFFIPRRLAKPMADVLVPAFAKARVWSEIAVAAMFLCLEGFSHWDPVLNDMLFLWSDYERGRATKQYSTHLAAFHPWKLSSPSRRVMLVEAMATADPSLRLLFHKVPHLLKWH